MIKNKLNGIALCVDIGSASAMALTGQIRTICAASVLTAPSWPPGMASSFGTTTERVRIGPGLILDAQGTANLRAPANAPEGFITLCHIFPLCA